ncbi:centromere DNA-binding protein complex CBF3 subunit [Hirsutella rhossiliensis]|uniref:Centromere DNA-binding protein complex CBF3 subunit n=1 Tax=Hirsutella rhossiliensis TaxID=111463 RepID=A0A9P8N6X9_9HYPO|nr:centromere DNA-binding protein complex CBF3 subunit [Hirsutella rhossiliensis]KAH0968743.1 centromere DNA-binding protein complex CBF3 subunit [Hirsutella rhossiliensis]
MGPQLYIDRVPFRTLVDLLVGHYLLTRGGDRRAADISDLFTFEFAGEGSTRCMPLIFTTRAGKQNQHGRLETAGAYRNRNPLICILGGLSFHLLYRWDLGSEPFPDFSRRSSWYDIRLIKGNGADRTAAFSYNSQRDWFVKAFAYAGITSQKKTHVGRSSGARTAELKGISEDQIRRAGRWNQEQMVGCYLNSLPRKFMRTMAGHPPQIGCFEIRRAGVTPPEVLLSMIWPELDCWRGRFGPGTEQENDLAAMGSTNLFFYLQEVVLQDSVVLMKKYPGSPVWNHTVFRHPAYAPFAQQLSDFILEEERPNQLAVLIQAMPVLADYLESIDARNEARTVQLKAELTDQLRATEERLAVAQSSLFSNGFNFQVTAATNTTATTAAAVVDAVEQGGRGDGSRFVSARSSIIDSRATSPTATDTIMVKPEPPPRYKMFRAAKIVEALWSEWTVGLRGGPAIADLDSRWGSCWRAGQQNELQWYSLRLEVIREIRKVAKAHRCSEEAATHIVNLQQQQTGRSLDVFCKQLRANSKAQIVRPKR